MDETIKTIIANSPSTAAVILVAWMFLKEIRAQRSEYFGESQQRLGALKEISTNHDAAHKECGAKLAEVVEENTRVLSRNSVALERCEAVHRKTD